MRLKSLLLIAALTAAPVTTAPRAFAQRVRELKGANLTSGKLLTVLTPKGPRPRGIGLKPPECTHYRKQAARGIELAPKADIASIEVEFEVNSSDLTPQAEKTLDTLGSALGSAALKPCCFEIQGYTDANGGEELNQKLSEARAQSVITYLTDHAGIEKDRMMPKGFGKSHPLASNATESGRAQNRRVQVVNLGYGTAAAD
jgi:outer membrane protein OmpA-like peptidoglycan-associated protein